MSKAILSRLLVEQALISDAIEMKHIVRGSSAAYALLSRSAVPSRSR
jgi:hypothetical protein